MRQSLRAGGRSVTRSRRSSLSSGEGSVLKLRGKARQLAREAATAAFRQAQDVLQEPSPGALSEASPLPESSDAPSSSSAAVGGATSAVSSVSAQGSCSNGQTARGCSSSILSSRAQSNLWNGANTNRQLSTLIRRVQTHRRQQSPTITRALLQLSSSPPPTLNLSASSCTRRCFHPMAMDLVCPHAACRPDGARRASGCALSRRDGAREQLYAPRSKGRDERVR